MKKNNRGVTLIEVLIAALVLVITIGAALKAYQYHLQLAQLSKDKAEAVADMRDIMETISATPYSQITTIFPDGVVDGGAFNDYSALVGGYILDNQRMTVSYPNPLNTPLEIIVSVQWYGPRARLLNLSLSTFKAE